jgi:hypothetical protein
MKKNTKDVPSTWPAGMNWHALPYLCDVFRWSLIDPNTGERVLLVFVKTHHGFIPNSS